MERCSWWSHPVGSGQQAWLGHVLGLSRLTLRSPTSGDEMGFVIRSSDRLCNVWYKVMIIYVFIYVYWLLFQMDVPNDPSDLAFPVQLTQYLTRIVLAVMALLQVGVMSIPKLIKRVPPVVRERIILVQIFLTQLTAFDKYYTAKLYGFSNPVSLFPDLERYTDSFVLLLFCTFLMGSHFLPVRWFLLVSVELLIVSMYGACVFLLASPEPRGAMCFLHLVVLVLLVTLGKRQSEVNERLVFAAFLQEKSLRLQAEFQLSRAADAKGKEEDDQGSIAPTTATGEAFTGLAAEDETGSSLETIWQIGKREQWLISEHELAVHPQECLGSGGFGVVIAGEFHGSPAALKLQIKTGSSRPLLLIGNELRLMRKLRHPNIVLFHGACLSMRHNDMILVMERVVGQSMLEFVFGEPLPNDRWKASMDICHALRYLHSRSPAITHCDLKPANIIVESRREGIHAKLLDFGLARLLTRRSVKPGGGTYRWVAPGVLSAKGAVRVEDDVYAFGLLMYFAATSQLPFAALGDRALKAYATGQNDACPALDWPRHMSELAKQYKPVVDQCVHPVSGERPPMATIDATLRGVRIGAKDKGGDDRARGSDDQQPRGGEDPKPEELWPKLNLARHIALQRSKLRKKLPQLAKLQKEQTASAESRQLDSVPEQDSVHDSNSSGPQSATSRFGALKATPTYTMIAALVDTMSSWNGDLAPESCCEFHASVHLTRSLCKLLARRECAQLRTPGTHIYQCPSCQMLIIEEEDGLEDLDCHGCGYEGPPGAHVVT